MLDNSKGGIYVTRKHSVRENKTCAYFIACLNTLNKRGFKETIILGQAKNLCRKENEYGKRNH